MELHLDDMEVILVREAIRERIAVKKQLGRTFPEFQREFEETARDLENVLKRLETK